MGRLFAKLLAVSAVVLVAIGAAASAAGPGGWDHLGDGGTPGSDSLDAAVYALHETPGTLYVGGAFTNAGGNPDADRIAGWNGTSWSAVSSPTSQISNGAVFAIAVAGGKLYAGGSFQDAGGNANADDLAVWDGVSWAPVCNAVGPAFTGNVVALQVIGSTLYAAGSFQNGAGIASADYVIACDLASGTPSSTVDDPAHPFSGSVYALTADSSGRLYAGGGFVDLENLAAADDVAVMDGSGWQAMGSGSGPCGCAVKTFVRSLVAAGGDVYVGTDDTDVQAIPQADNVVRWDGSAWHAVGASSDGANGWFPAATSINGLGVMGSNVFATGSFLDAGGDPRADDIAVFDGSAWHPVGSDGAGNGPWSGNGTALAVVDQRLYAGGNFTSAGGDPQAHSTASFALNQIIAVATPTVTPGPAAVPTPTPTPSPTADTTAPRTTLAKARILQGQRKATFSFRSGEPGSTFRCKLDGRPFKPCSSPKTYKKLKPGKHVFRVKARDAAGNTDATPTVKRFRIKRS